MLTSNFLLAIYYTLILTISLILGFPIIMLLIECIAALLPNRNDVNYSHIPQPKLYVIIPAHNEESCISATLLSLKNELKIDKEVIVVADNCTDNTAAIARQYNAIVLERTDSLQRGKGYALDFGFQYMKANPPEVVIVIDADCTVHKGAIERLAKMAITKNRPIQATNLLKPPEKMTARDAFSTLAFLVKNLVRQRGMQNLALPATLTGTGMALPWFLISKATIATANIAEDKQQGIDLAIAGYNPIFCEEALVTGYFPQTKKAGNTQKMRWVHGHLQTLTTQVPRLILAGVQQKRFDLITIALDLAVLPISLLVTLWLICTSIALSLSALLATSWLPTTILLIEGLLLLIAITSAWLKFGRTDLPIRMLLKIPVYILWNIGIYWSFIIKPQKSWIRTERDK
jgi:cellulose synthase/poly-beta-1,6-N-acetylglucosamine synthase-like glycosyltransferase